MAVSTNIQFVRLCASLQAEEKARRKQALEEILSYVFPKTESLDEKALLDIWEQFHRPVVKILHDQAEACRDLAVEILRKFLTLLPCSDKHIVYVIPILTKRLGSQEMIEMSEEVRLKCITLLIEVVLKYQEKLAPYFDDLVIILTKTVTDNYPKVKKESCDCICNVAKALPRHFYSRSDSFIKPILTNFSHQHYRIRVASIMTIGQVLLYGNCKSIEDVATPLAERLFDQSGVVRAAVIQVVGQWMVELKDRYSWWHKLIPLLLTGLHDEIEDIRNSAGKLWSSAGEQYMKENETDQKLKDKMDFLIDDPDHYPENILRPNLGCRTLAQQNLCKLVGGIIRELGDWMADIRVRSAQLLCVLVLNVEEHFTQHLVKLLPSMYRACNDEDNRVVVNVERAAEYVGYFVPLDTYYPLIQPTLEENPTAGHFRVFAAILKGTPRKALVLELEKIGTLLSQTHICRSRKGPYQMQIINCCESILSVCKEDSQCISNELFSTIFTVLAMSINGTIQNKAEKLLYMLSVVENLENLNQLYNLHIRDSLVAATQQCESWIILSPEFLIFRACIIRAPTASSQHFDLILTILERTTGNEADPEVRLKQFLLLSEYLEQRDESCNLELTEGFVNFANAILEKVIIPGLLWSAGRTAETIRTASVCCLCCLFDKILYGSTDNADVNISKDKEYTLEETERISHLTVEHFSWLFEKVTPILVTLIDDNAKKTRLYSLRAICGVMKIGQKLSCVSEDHIHRIYPVILKRLDDGCDDVRCTAIQALREVWSRVPKDYDLKCSKCHIDTLYTSAIVHLDDPDDKFQELLLEAMKDLGKVHPELLIDKIHNCRGNFRNQKGLDQLLTCAQDYLREK